jgi:hypothetical protein
MAIAPSVDDEVETKTAAKADTGLGRLFAAHELLKEKTGKSFSAIVDYVEKHDLSREVIKLTLMESRGLTEGSANSEASRIRNLLKPKFSDVREKLSAGEITVAAARTQTSKRQEAPARSPKDIVDERLISAAGKAIVEPGYFSGLEDFLEAARDAWKVVKARLELKNAKRDKANSNGGGDEDLSPAGVDAGDEDEGE